MRPLRVGIVAESYFPSLGAFRSTSAICATSCDRRGRGGHDPDRAPGCVAARPGPRTPSRAWFASGAPTPFAAAAPSPRPRSARVAAYNFHRALRERQFDLLNIHGPCDVGLAFWALSMFRGPKVLTLHSCFPDARWRHRVAAYYRWVFRRAAAVIAVSEATAQSMGRYADFQSTIIPNGIDVAYWRASPERPLPAARDAKPRLSRPARAAQRTRGGDRGLRQDRARAARRAAADGGRRSDARASWRRRSRRTCASASNSSGRSTTSVRSCSPRRRCSCCRRGRSDSPSWCWRRSPPACPSWRCPPSGPIGRAITGRT